MEMAFTTREILKLYNGASNKEKQLVILADMNLCKVETIINFLVEHGASVDPEIIQKNTPGAPPVPVSRKLAIKIDWVDIIRQLDDGVSADDIGPELGMTGATIRRVSGRMRKIYANKVR